MGFITAATLDDARGLAPGHAPTARRRLKQPPIPLAFPALPSAPSASPTPDQPDTAAPDAAPLAEAPGRDADDTPLEELLREGRLSNPGAIPSLEEEAQHAAREEEGQRSRLNYEIADEHTPTLIQQESEDHEDCTIATIRKTSLAPTPPAAPAKADPQPPPTHPETAEQPPGPTPEDRPSRDADDHPSELEPSAPPP